MNAPQELTIHETKPFAGEGDTFQELARVEVDVTIEGTAAIHIEPNSHSVSWCVQPSGNPESSSLRVLRPEDEVTITSAEGAVLFDGSLAGVFHFLEPIHIYRDINGHKSPPAGFAIYWSPQGVDPFTWLSFFEGRNNVTIHRHSTALVAPEFAAIAVERMKVAKV